MQQLSHKHLNENVRYNTNALAELNDCIGSLLHLGPNVITLRTLLHLGQLLHLGLQQLHRHDAIRGNEWYSGNARIIVMQHFS